VTLYWLSFCDSDRPKGQQFLGACLVPAGETGDHKADLRIALQNAWLLGCNPGGEVRFQPVPATVESHIRDFWVGRLLTREEAQKFEEEIKPYGVS
jgi:hypothetical protein